MASWPVAESHGGKLFTPLRDVSNGDLSVNVYGFLGTATDFSCSLAMWT